ncbi:hypothetical protein [Streptomyces massasporeus]|uniref:hypothetical protein n=1 Tax=Streptomyces massasporeus TaxID=67324 RepID=UPI003816556A
MSSLEDRVRKWLSDQGYPLEMRVARIVGAAGAGWDHGRVYTDPVTEKTREIDLFGYFDGPRQELSVHVVFECKHSRDKPWVLFGTDRPGLTPTGLARSTPATPLVKKALARTLRGRRMLSPVTDMTMFRAPDGITGFNLARAHTDNQDAAFHAVRGVSAAAEETARDIGSHGHAVLYLPVVVIDTPLIRCFLPAEEEDVQLEQVERGVLLTSSRPGSYTFIHVVTVEALPSFMSQVAVESADLRTLLEPQLKYVRDLPDK